MLRRRHFLFVETWIQWKTVLNLKRKNIWNIKQPLHQVWKYEISNNPCIKCENREAFILVILLKAAGKAINKNELQSNPMISIFTVMKLDFFPEL